MDSRIIGYPSCPCIAPNTGTAIVVIDTDGNLTSQGDATTIHSAYLRVSRLTTTTVNTLGQRNIAGVAYSNKILTVTFSDPMPDENYHVSGEWCRDGGVDDRTFFTFFTGRTVNGFQCAFTNASESSRIDIPLGSTGFVTISVTR